METTYAIEELPDVQGIIEKYARAVTHMRGEIKTLQERLAKAEAEKALYKNECEVSIITNKDVLERLLAKLEIMVSNTSLFETERKEELKRDLPQLMSVVQEERGAPFVTQAPPSPTMSVSGTSIAATEFEHDVDRSTMGDEEVEEEEVGDEFKDEDIESLELVEALRSGSPGIQVYPPSPKMTTVTSITTNDPELAKRMEEEAAAARHLSQERADQLLLESREQTAKEQRSEARSGSTSESLTTEGSGEILQQALNAPPSPVISQTTYAESGNIPDRVWQGIVEGLELVAAKEESL